MQNDLLNIEKIRELVKNRKIDWTKHRLNRLNQRNITIKDVKNAINSGFVIECYRNDYPYPSCLILGYSIKNKILHVVCGVSHEYVHMITAYYPNQNKWEDDMKIRRKQ